jgi:hypothetical protein
MGLEIIGIIVAVIAAVVPFLIKRKQEQVKDHDALARVDADELSAGMDRVDQLHKKPGP